MSQYQPALSYVLNWEDPKREYLSTPDVGGYAIAGINSHSWPSDYAKISEAPQSARSQLVYDFYQKNFWNPMKIGGLLSQDVANRVLDQGVNGGSEGSIRLLQKAIIACGVTAGEDGVFGPQTMEAANSLDPDRLLSSFRNQRLSFYKKVVDNNEHDAQYFDGWEKRALA